MLTTYSDNHSSTIRLFTAYALPLIYFGARGRLNIPVIAQLREIVNQRAVIEKISSILSFKLYYHRV